jgi:predicted nucleotide-binding protein (sugar kinase/HSP70/actin superfamily)
VTIGGFIRAVREAGNDPARHALFMPTAEGPCRFGQYATLHRIVLDREGWRHTPIMSPASFNAYQGLEQEVRKAVWRGMLAGDVLFKAGCRVRPYERELGATDRAVKRGHEILLRAAEQRRDLRPVLRDVIAEVAAVPQDRRERKPVVGVVGEIYVRCNLFSNEEVCRAIEQAGGEAWLAPISEWIIYTSWTQRHQAFRGVAHFPNPVAIAASLLKNHFIVKEEHDYYHHAGALLADRREPYMDDVMREGSRFVPTAFVGETVITLGRAIMFARQGADMVVNCAPFGCMPGTLTSSCLQEVQAETGIPMVSMFYDGDLDLNGRIASYLANLPRDSRAAAHEKREPRLQVGPSA